MKSDPKNTLEAAGGVSQASWYLLFAAWLLASAATLGSLFLSEVMGMTPCPLCWYQRVFMYALVPVLLAGMHPLDPRAARYAAPLAVLGWLTAFYHLLVYEGIIPEKMQPCGSDNSWSHAMRRCTGDHRMSLESWKQRGCKAYSGRRWTWRSRPNPVGWSITMLTPTVFGNWCKH